MADSKPISDAEAGDRMQAALDALGQAPGETVAANTALRLCRMVLLKFYFSLIQAGENRDQLDDPPYPPPRDPLPEQPSTSPP